MNKLRIIKLSSVGLLILVMFAGTLFTIFGNKSSKDVNAEAKIAGFENLADLEEKSPIIVKGIKIGEHDPIFSINPDDGTIFTGYTISDFQITTTIKNSTKDDLTTDFIIQIFENEAYNKETNTNYHVAGYEKMEVGNEYLLFLRQSLTAENYIPMGVIYGKIPLEEKEKQTKFALENTSSAVQQIKNLAKEKYNDFK